MTYEDLIDTMMEYGLTVQNKEVAGNKIEMDKIKEELQPIILEIIILYPEILNEISDIIKK